MKILISVGHPAHVHFFKNIIWALEKNGHTVKIVARDKEVVLDLLNYYNLDYELISSKGNGIINLAFEMLKRHFKLFKVIKKIKPDVVLSGFDPSVAQIGKLLGTPTIVFADNRPTVTKFPPIGPLVIPFADTILTLTSVKYDFGPKEVRMDGYKELAYLHPNYFKPDPKIITKFDLPDNFILLRFVGLGAYHDIGGVGFDLEAKMELIKQLEKYAKVFISSEESLPAQLEKYNIPIPPEKIHDFLYYAKLLICDSQTMTTEAAILGTPAIRCNSFVGKNDMGNFIELEQKYGLIFNYSNSDEAISKAVELVQKPDLKDEWKTKRNKLLKEKIDVTSFIVDFIEKYPDNL